MVTPVSGDFGVVSQMSVILYEGTVTVASGTLDYMGSAIDTCNPASPIVQGEWVALSTDTANTYDATGGLPVVTKVANGTDLLLGQIIDTPRWVKIPATTQSTWANMLSGGYYRVATIEMPPILVGRAILTTANAANVVPGTVGILDADASAVVGKTRLTFKDCASGGAANIFSFHYQAQATGVTANILVGIRQGFGTVGD